MYFLTTKAESIFVFRIFAYMGTNLTKSHEGRRLGKVCCDTVVVTGPQP
jgi:hypothetical protein